MPQLCLPCLAVLSAENAPVITFRLFCHRRNRDNRGLEPALETTTTDYPEIESDTTVIWWLLDLKGALGKKSLGLRIGLFQRFDYPEQGIFFRRASPLSPFFGTGPRSLA